MAYLVSKMAEQRAIRFVQLLAALFALAVVRLRHIDDDDPFSMARKNRS